MTKEEPLRVELQMFRAEDDIRESLKAIYDRSRSYIDDVPQPWQSEDTIDDILEKTSGLCIFMTMVINSVNPRVEHQKQPRGAVPHANDNRPLQPADNQRPGRPACEYVMAVSDDIFHASFHDFLLDPHVGDIVHNGLHDSIKAS
ncbi:hypothetical protein FIBSPDRAFT_949318 [Athelia psychrophila]|uniref:Uncharacterized protein n=1 Tax=Athelia psychrophila TaxID=1759441 RepID=A0A166PTN1_9AGAM|nr:hypothetical protein FIBSPDRAFT_949318 [Fibularhizoctonia sp. CBS 109695]